MELIEKFKAWKKDNDLTTTGVAEALGISVSHASMIESGKRGFSRNVQRRLVKNAPNHFSPKDFFPEATA